MKQLKLFNLAWPIFIETALFMLLGFVDVFVLSRYDDLAASAVGTANQAVSIVTIVFTVISGASAVLSNASVIIRNHGLTKITMYVTVGMNIVNTGLDVLFVLGLLGFPKLGVMGVAIATTFSRIAGMIVLGIILFTKVEKPSIFKLLKPFPKDDLKDIFKIGIPSALETFLYNLSQLVITSLVLNFLTEAELITKTYVQNITMFFYLFAVAIAQASQIITGHLVGAKKTDEAYRRGFRSYSFALAIAAGICVIGVILRSQLMGIFTADEAVITMGANILLINTVLEFGRTTNLVMIASLRGAGDVLFPTMCAVFSNWMISVLCSYIFAVVLGMGIYGLWIAIIGDELVRGILMLLRWKSGKWKSKGVVRTENKKTSQSLKLTGQDKYAVQK